MTGGIGQALIAGAIVGAVCGLLPLIFGASRGDIQIGVVGLVACIIGGVVLGLILAVPIAIGFAIWIHRRTRGRTTATTTT